MCLTMLNLTVNVTLPSERFLWWIKTVQRSILDWTHFIKTNKTMQKWAGVRGSTTEWITVCCGLLGKWSPEMLRLHTIQSGSYTETWCKSTFVFQSLSTHPHISVMKMWWTLMMLLLLEPPIPWGRQNPWRHVVELLKARGWTLFLRGALRVLCTPTSSTVRWHFPLSV